MKSVDKRITRKKLVVLIRSRWWFSKHECIANLANWRLSRVETVKKKKNLSYDQVTQNDYTKEYKKILKWWLEAIAGVDRLDYL